MGGGHRWLLSSPELGSRRPPPALFQDFGRDRNAHASLASCFPRQPREEGKADHRENGTSEGFCAARSRLGLRLEYIDGTVLLGARLPYGLLRSRLWATPPRPGFVAEQPSSSRSARKADRFLFICEKGCFLLSL